MQHLLYMEGDEATAVGDRGGLVCGESRPCEGSYCQGEEQTVARYPAVAEYARRVWALCRVRLGRVRSALGISARGNDTGI